MDDDDNEYGSGDDDFEVSGDASATAAVAAASTERDAEDSDDDAADGEDELRPAASPDATAPRQRSQALQDALAVDDDALLGSDSDSVSSTGEDAHKRGKRTTRSQQQRVSGRHLLSNALWTFSISVTRIRSLQIPVVKRTAASKHRGSAPPTPVIRELRVFATIDRRAMQSQGSEWKREPRPETPRPQRRVPDHQSSSASRTRAASSTVAVALAARRSGFFNEATWRQQHGRLEWTMRMERYRRLKASSPRVKVLVFGIGENAVDATVQRLHADSAHAHSESIVSCGWFFLDLRTPDLPAKWLKLQNGRFGGEVLVSTALAPLVVSAQEDAQRSATAVATASPLLQLQHFRPAVDSAPAVPQPPVPIVVEPDSECLLLGDSGGRDVFVISCFLRAAFNLQDVVTHALNVHSTTATTTADRRGYWFSYALFDVVVRTDVFYDLTTAEFPPIRDSFRVQSCTRDVVAFVRQQQQLQIYLCTYDIVLAGVDIPLTSLLQSELLAARGASADTAPVAIVGLKAVVEGNFAFQHATTEASSAFVDVSVTIECVQVASAARVRDGGDATASHRATIASADPRDAPSLSHHNDPIERVESPRASTLNATDAAIAASSNASPVREAAFNVRVTLDHIRLRTAAVAAFAGDDNIALELAVGDVATATNAVRFSAFTTTHALGDNDALVLLLPATTFTIDELVAAQLSVRCVATASKRLIGASESIVLMLESQHLLSTAAAERESHLPKMRLETLELVSDRDAIGDCTVRIELLKADDDDADEQPMDDSASELAAQQAVSRLSGLSPTGGNSSNGLLHVFRVVIQLTSLRDFVDSQTFASIAYTHPFTNKGTIDVTRVRVERRREQQLQGALCVFEIVADAAQFKHAMQAAIAIDFAASDSDHITTATSSQVVGTAVFSLNFLFYSQERFCCSAAACNATFATQADGDAHWRATHCSSSNEDGEETKEEEAIDRRIHGIKSCAIELPVISSSATTDAVSGSHTPSSSSTRRIGTIGIAAYAEDLGEVCTDDATALDRIFVPSTCAQAIKRLTEFTVPAAPSNATASNSVRDDKRAAATAAVAPAPTKTTDESATNTRDADARTYQRAADRDARERQQLQQRHADAMAAANEAHAHELAQFRRALERDKQQWLATQEREQTQWKQRAEAIERTRMGELEDEWARREEERSALLHTTQREYERLEAALRTSLLELDARERQLAAAEHAQQREQQLQRDELEAARKRLQNEHAHALAIAHKQAEANEVRVQTLSTQLQDAETRARQVEADFAEYRAQQRKVPESRLREEIASLKTALLELERQKLQQETLRAAADANAATLTTQLEAMARLVQREKHKHAMRVSEELEKLRVKYVAREEKFVLDGDRDELRAIKRQLDELKGDRRLQQPPLQRKTTSRSSSVRSSVRSRPVAVAANTREPLQQRTRSNSPMRPSWQRSDRQREHSVDRQHQQSATRRRTHDQQHRNGQTLRGLQQQPRGAIHNVDDNRCNRLDIESLRSNRSWNSQRSFADATTSLSQRRRVFERDSVLPHDRSDEGSDDGDNASNYDGSSEYYEHSDGEENRGQDDSDGDSSVAPFRQFGHVYENDNESADGGDNDANSENLRINGIEQQQQQQRRHNDAADLERLERERKLLLASGAYTTQSHLVRELTRVIAAVRARR